ncbi:glycoside hydrolase superfamily [Entophlyctis helioformis]|nr:glycoside hydrolase superfamily [Entophlyctis helioformis]
MSAAAHSVYSTSTTDVALIDVDDPDFVQDRMPSVSPTPHETQHALYQQQQQQQHEQHEQQQKQHIGQAVSSQQHQSMADAFEIVATVLPDAQPPHTMLPNINGPIPTMSPIPPAGRHNIDLMDPFFDPTKHQPLSRAPSPDTMSVQHPLELGSADETAASTSAPITPIPAPLMGTTDGVLSGLTSPTRNLLPLTIVAEEYPPDLRPGLNEIARHCVHRNFCTLDAMADTDDHYDESAFQRLCLKFTLDEALPAGCYRIRCSHASIREVAEGQRLEAIVSYQRRIEAFRALGYILGAIFAIDDSGSLSLLTDWSAQAQFDSIGPMIDCSRAAVLRVDAVMYMLRNSALMGLNTFQLYTEDTYKVPGEPFFGFMRGAYTEDEMRAIDDYAADFGIEVFPCIQTLGHLGQILQWPAYAHLKDTSEVLLASQDETYVFIRKLVRAASAPLRSRRVHIGMDEANGMGEGRYQQIFGNKDAIQIYMEHLQRVNEICLEEGLQPLIWSDMLFTLANHNNPQAYYDGSPVPLGLNQSLPRNVQLVYWDYYHTHTDMYSRKIQQHRELGFEPWVASAVWTWNRMFAALPFTFDAARACLSACKGLGVRNMIVTLWGDDGNEYDLLSALPALAYFGEHAYLASDDVDWSTLKRNFAAISGGRLEDWIYASKLDSIPNSLPRRERFPPNPSKWILWQDPLYSFLSPQYHDQDVELHYTEMAKYLVAASSDEVSLQTYPLNRRLRFPALIAHTLSLKANIRDRCVQAYKAASVADRVQQLGHILDTRIRPLQRALEELHQFHRGRVWLDTYKPFGLEIVEMRYGAVLIRLKTLEERVLAYCRYSSQEASRGSNMTNDANGPDNRSGRLNGFTGTGSRHGTHSGSNTLHYTPFPTSPDSSIPEFEVDLVYQPYPGHGMDLMFDFARSYTPSRALGAG